MAESVLNHIEHLLISYRLGEREIAQAVRLEQQGEERIMDNPTRRIIDYPFAVDAPTTPAVPTPVLSPCPICGGLFADVLRHQRLFHQPSSALIALPPPAALPADLVALAREVKTDLSCWSVLGDGEYQYEGRQMRVFKIPFGWEITVLDACWGAKSWRGKTLHWTAERHRISGFTKVIFRRVV